ncbi:MAG: HlyD family secretion protein [Beijerinckiaceae bacterium]
MLIIVMLYLLVVWLVFFKLKILPLNWTWGTAAGLLGVTIIAVFVALLNTLTPSGRITVIGRVVEVTPNVAGSVTEIAVEPNVPVQAGALLFQIDKAPYEAKVKQLTAAVAEARQKVEQLKAQVELTVADVKGLASQLEYAERRRNDLERLAKTSATTEFKLQDALAQVSLLDAQLQAARAREINARLALGSEIDGVNTSVAQLQAQLEQAEWELDQTSVRAAQDGYVSTMALAVGARAMPMRSALSLIVRDDITIVGIFDQNGFKSIKPGSNVRLVFASRPGAVYVSRVADVSWGIGQGQLAVSGTLARAETIGTATTYPARIETPLDVDPEALRLGMVGTATVISDSAGPIGVLASILLWVKAYAAYL